MTSTSVSVAAVAAAPLSAASGSMTKAGAIARAAHDLLLHLERGQRIDAPMLRTAMESAFGASDADGGWNWKMAYDAGEAATVLFLRKFGPAMRARAASPAAMLPMLAKDRQPSSHPHPPFGRERSASAVQYTDHAWRLRRALLPRSRRPTLCWSHRPVRVCSPSWPSCRAHRSFSTSSPKPALDFFHFSFPASPSRASTPRISTIISIPVSRQASC